MTAQDTATDSPETAAVRAGTDSAPAAPEPPPIAVAPVVVERKRPGLYVMAVVGLLLSTASAAAIATLPVWQDQLAATWHKPDAGAARAFLIATSQLQQAVAGTAPYGDALTLVQALAPKGVPEAKAALDVLARGAAKGVPRTPDLRTRFVGVFNEVYVGETLGTAPGWIDLSVIRNSSAVQLESLVGALGRNQATPAIAALRNADAQLAAGNLKDAVASVQTLSGRPAEVASAWLADAKLRLEVDAAARTLEQAAKSHLQAATKPTELSAVLAGLAR
ncbi:mitofilin family membrane protein [Azospirillum sp.]|uniref:mitofilin family membrane protein n=1 Tax=Azospirillum sp. TaxID=34012 RepID=UPI002D65F85A|nr:mitofilin family membrane protein [Azospirillum sp.]HYD68294.1 mitofilin family membrane protein [Azospirillum sp.]